MQAQSYSNVSSLRDGPHADSNSESYKVSFMSEYEVHSPTAFIRDTPVLMEVANQAKQKLPDPEDQRSSIPDSAPRVSNQGEMVPIDAYSGLYQRELLNREEAMNNPCSLVVSKSKEFEKHVDVRNKALANWTRYENCVRNEEEKNLVVFLYFGGILYRCILPIKPGQGLLVWHKEGRSSDLNITLDFLKRKKCPINEMKSTLVKLFSCSPCPLSYTSPIQLDTCMWRNHPGQYVGEQKSGQDEEADDDNNNNNKKKKNPKASVRSTSQQISSHSLSYGQSQEDMHDCSERGESFASCSSLRLHQHIHTTEKPRYCSQYERSFTEQSAHANRKSYQSGKPLKHQSRLYQQQLVQTPEKPQVSIEEHQLIHGEENLFKCSECGKCFTKLYHLQQHKRSHAKEKPFHCQQCGKTYLDKSSLRRHQRRHIVEMPYVCTQCGETFMYYKRLKQHKLFHSIVKSYQCSPCGKSFNYQSNLKKHQRTHMDDKPY